LALRQRQALELEVEIKRDGSVYVRRYQRGVPEAPLAAIGLGTILDSEF
jgi:hypothetical protein